MAAAFRSAWGLSDLSDRARRPPPSIARARQCVPANAASSGTGDVSVMPGWVVDLNAEEACSLDAVVEAEIRNSSRPGSQAPHAPPALTFGLPGKQTVKSVQAGCVLIRPVSTLPRNRKVLPMNEPCPQPGRLLQQPPRKGDRTTSARVSPPARSGRAGNRRTRCPGPSAP